MWEIWGCASAGINVRDLVTSRTLTTPELRGGWHQRIEDGDGMMMG